MNLLAAILGIIVILQFWNSLKSIYKISYYETRLENNGIDIKEVKSMSLYKMLFS